MPLLSRLSRLLMDTIFLQLGHSTRRIRDCTSLLGLDVAAWSHHSSKQSAWTTQRQRSSWQSSSATLRQTMHLSSATTALGAWISSLSSPFSRTQILCKKPMLMQTRIPMVQVAKMRASSIRRIFDKSTGLLKNGAHARAHALEPKAAGRTHLAPVRPLENRVPRCVKNFQNDWSILDSQAVSALMTKGMFQSFPIYWGYNA